MKHFFPETLDALPYYDEQQLESLLKGSPSLKKALDTKKKREIAYDMYKERLFLVQIVSIPTHSCRNTHLDFHWIFSRRKIWIGQLELFDLAHLSFS